MALVSREKFAHLDVYRPVVDDYTFADKVRHLSLDHFGVDYPTTIRTADPEGDGSTVLYEGVSQAVVETYGMEDMYVSLLHRGSPIDVRVANRFGWSAHRLSKRKATPYRRDSAMVPGQEKEHIVSAASELHDRLRQAGLPFDLMPDQHERSVVVECSDLAIVNDQTIPFNDTVEIGLNLAPESPVTSLLIQQSRMCFDALRKLSRSQAYPAAPAPLAIPFVRLPLRPSQERDKFVRSVRELLPVRMQLGGIAITSYFPITEGVPGAHR